MDDGVSFSSSLSSLSRSWLTQFYHISVFFPSCTAVNKSWPPLLKSVEEKYAYRYRRRLAISDDNDENDYGDASNCFADRRTILRSRVNARRKLSLIITVGNSSSSIRSYLLFSSVKCTSNCNCIIAFVSEIDRIRDFGVSPLKK
jgi:hypothetical protein